MTARILIVDDDPGLLELLHMRLTSFGYDVDSASNGQQALDCIQQHLPSLVISDLRMEPMDGMQLFRAIQAEVPGLPVILLTAHGTIPEAVAATQQGVFSFLTKPVDKHELRDAVQKAIAASTISSAHAADTHASAIITRNSAMRSLLGQIRLLNNSDVSVMISGESGTGKELLAKEIHQVSARAGHPFIAINCAAIPAELLESELFGHKKGAFTGAAKDHKGLFQAAQGGTLFLDEIGDMPAALQVKLLRVLQERSIRPVGATELVPIDVRIISATHKDLPTEITEQRFREDLYYRLNVVNFQLPPLRERKDDIPLLIHAFLQQLAARHQQRVRHLSPDGLLLLLHYDWPGNIRQLANIIEQLFALSPTPIITEQQVRDALKIAAPQVPSLTEAKRRFEKEYTEQLLRMTQGNVSEAAELAQRNRSDFHKIIKRHAIDPSQYK